MAKTSFQFGDGLKRRIKHRRLRGQNKSVWFRYTTEPTIAVDAMLDEIYELYQYDECQELIEAAVKKEGERRKSEIDNRN